MNFRNQFTVYAIEKEFVDDGVDVRKYVMQKSLHPLFDIFVDHKDFMAKKEYFKARRLYEYACCFYSHETVVWAFRKYTRRLVELEKQCEQV